MIRGGRLPFSGEFVRYGIVGASGVVVDLVALALLHEVFSVPLLAANVLSFSLAVTNNFILNRQWTFRARSHRRMAAGGGLFLLSALIGLGINEAGLWAFDSAHVHWVPAKLAMAVVVLAWNYTFNATITFRDQHHRLSTEEASPSLTKQ
jgi:putative flippase GtrA